MSLKKLITPFPWSRYSRKLKAKIENPRNCGRFTPDESLERGMRLVTATEGEVDDGNQVQFFWLVDPEDGTIVDAKFQVYGQSALIGAAEAVCDLIIGKNYDQAQRVGADLVDRQVRDKSDQPAFPGETAAHMNLVLEAVDACSEQCTDIPLPVNYAAPPAPMEIGEVLEGGIPGWSSMPPRKQMALVEQVLDQEIRPYIALDGGGVELKNVLNSTEIVIAYQGNCTSCFASMGTTLSYIQQMLRAKVHPDLVVVPDFQE